MTDSTRIAFHYIKSPLYRTVHVDGGIGGFNPTRNMQLTLYSERVAIPQRVVHEIGADGSLGPEIVAERQGKDGFVREMEITLVLSLDGTIALRNLLDAHIRNAVAKVPIDDEQAQTDGDPPE